MIRRGIERACVEDVAYRVVADNLTRHRNDRAPAMADG
jgi:hypothetical protein